MKFFLNNNSLAFFINNSTFGCLGLLLIVGFIVFLFLRRKKIQKGVNDFYQKHGLHFEENPPKFVRDMLGNANWQCFVGELEIAPGKIIPFYWWRGYISRLVSTGSSTQTSFDFFLAISFSPNVVSKEFQQKAQQLKDKKTSFGEKLKNFFTLDTKTPMRAEELADGSFLIEWHSLDRADIYEEKMNWLRDSLTANPFVETRNSTPTPIVEKTNEIEKISYDEIRRSAPLEMRAMIEVLMRVLDSMSRDYHDTKANPTMTIDDHAGLLNLNKEQIDFVKSSIHLTSYTPQELKRKGFDFSEVNSYTSQAADVTFPHRKMTYLMAQDIYLDFNEPRKIYVYQK